MALSRTTRVFDVLIRAVRVLFRVYDPSENICFKRICDSFIILLELSLRIKVIVPSKVNLSIVMVSTCLIP